MDERDLSVFADNIDGLCLAFKREPNKLLTKAYWLALNNLSVQEFTAACSRALTEAKFMPVPAELLSLSGRLSVSERAVLAYTSVISAVSSVGPYKAVCFVDRNINAVIRNMGGWPTFCQMFDHGPEDEKWARKDFIRTYESIGGRAVGDEEGGHLSGISTGQMHQGELVAPIPITIECESASAADKELQIEFTPQKYIGHSPDDGKPQPRIKQLAHRAIEGLL